MRIGLVDLDTSHPPSWIPILTEMGHTIAGVYDHGDIHPHGYAEQFVSQNNAGRVYPSLAAMANEVDLAILHGCDWDQHVERTKPFIATGTAILVDKPIAGRLADLRQFVAWSKAGHRIVGGSALRFAQEARELLRKPIEERGKLHTAFAGCAVDTFNYGIHGYSLLAALLGTGARSVRFLGGGPQERIQVQWEDGRMGILSIGASRAWLPFHASVVGELAVHSFVVDNSRIYRAILEATLPYLSKEADSPPYPIEELIEPELWALAALQSKNGGGVDVRLDEIAEVTAYDGSAFAREYQKAKYPPMAVDPPTSR